MRKRYQITVFIILVFAGDALSQEIVTGLFSNPGLTSAEVHAKLKSSKGSDTLSLPFIDDFSDTYPYPSEKRWEDNFVFINNTFSETQITKGVATFDCLDQFGKLYEEAGTGLFEADKLTSKHIDLALTPADSVYFSFLYEAGGVADMPETNDSLTLNFWAPEEQKWYCIWRAKGESTAGFRQVMIPVVSTRYLKKGFRFRFTNYASLSGVNTEPSKAGNADQWNVDYIRVYSGRNISDTIFRDVAVTRPLRSLLKNYEAMPWDQFLQAYLTEMNGYATLRYKNNEDSTRNVLRYVSIYDVYKNKVSRLVNCGNQNIDPFAFVTSALDLTYTFSSGSTDSALFLVKAFLETKNSYDPRDNDTIRFYQYFTDYFAIDDGTAEAGYGLNGQGSRNAMAALRFRSYIADSVSAIRFCFNDAYANANQRAFDIMVWSDDNGKPGTLLGSTEGSVAAPGQQNNGFVTYRFDTPIPVTGYFWVGWRQLSETFLNTGLDLNTDPGSRQYYWINGSWQLSQAPGVIMMRPVMTGKGSASSSENNNLYNNLYRIYPNPTTGTMTLQASDDVTEDVVIDIYNLQGTRVITLPGTPAPDVSMLSPGYYVMIIRTRKGVPLTALRFSKIN